VVRRHLAAAAFALLMGSGLCGRASAEVLISIDKSEQRMTVSVDGSVRHVWPVSTGRSGYGTPNGHFRPQWLARKYFSRKYYDSPMPHSIFFHEGYAIHGTEYIRRLGGPASHGCVRLHPKNAAALFALVTEQGKANTRIVVTGNTGSERIAKRSKVRLSAEDRQERRRDRAERSRRNERAAASYRYWQNEFAYPAPRFYYYRASGSRWRYYNGFTDY
jgi:hypothetical protein